MDLDKLHVVTMISNPVRYKSRYALYKIFEEHMAKSGVNLWTVEVAFGKRPFEITQAGNPRHLQLRSFDEVWLKENAINLMIQRLPLDWKYVCWIDADVQFMEHNWLEETWHALQHYAVVQMWSNAIDTGPNGDAIFQHTSFMNCHVNGLPFGPMKKGQYSYGYAGHPGYAWAANRYAMDYTGGLLDTAAAGAADHHMALGLVGRAKASLPDNIHPRYAEKVLTWQDRALYYLKKDVGYVPGTIRHYWHGKKRDRRYGDRWKILTDHHFNPDTDLVRDVQGLWQIDNRKEGLRDDLRAYFRSRHEDSIDME